MQSSPAAPSRLCLITRRVPGCLYCSKTSPGTATSLLAPLLHSPLCTHTSVPPCCCQPWGQPWGQPALRAAAAAILPGSCHAQRSVWQLRTRAFAAQRGWESSWSAACLAVPLPWAVAPVRPGRGGQGERGFGSGALLVTRSSDTFVHSWRWAAVGAGVRGAGAAQTPQYWHWCLKLSCLPGPTNPKLHILAPEHHWREECPPAIPSSLRCRVRGKHKGMGSEGIWEGHGAAEGMGCPWGGQAVPAHGTLLSSRAAQTCTWVPKARGNSPQGRSIEVRAPGRASSKAEPG